MPALRRMQSFETLFRVPPEHRLVQVRSRSRGGPGGGTSWGHEEYDAGGRLIARFESYSETGPDGRRTRGWRKFDPLGRLLDHGFVDGPLAPPSNDRQRAASPSPLTPGIRNRRNDVGEASMAKLTRCDVTT